MRTNWWNRLIKMGGLLLTVGLFSGGVIYAYAPHPPKTPTDITKVAELEQFLTKLVAAGNPPGLSIVVVKDGKLVYNRAFGLADGPKQIAASPETVYHWWSMTKIVTAIAILQLHEQGRLRLDDPVTVYLPDFAVQYPAGSQPMTIRHLLNHSAGLVDPVPAMLGWVHYQDELVDQTALLKRHLPSHQKLQFAPGSKASYSNLGYMVLGAVIEAVSGQSYADYVTDHLLRPLGMTQTGFLYTPALQAQAASGSQPLVHLYTPLLPFLLDTNALIRERAGRTLWMNRVYIDALPSSGMIGSAPDVGRLLLAYLNGGELAGVRILSPASVTLMTEESQVLGEGPNMAAYAQGRHGLGWYVIPEGRRVRLQHHGGGAGFATTMRLYPAEQLGIAILANSTDLDRDGLADRLAQIDWATR
ncbi:MAG: class A beta-lactamase-related serine hydrolase [Caldilinea sp. CFX5]|nr:class A beta-lactamase-related serine hydrolase [Caldilinea sp. CFX5]